METFRPVDDDVTTVFTCGPSIYQQAHIGNFRTFLFEDILVRYLAYLGYSVKRGMNFTDIEDKAIQEAKKRNVSVQQLTEENINGFVEEMKRLRMRIPDYLPKASESVDDAVGIIECLLDRGIAYWHGRNIYFDPLRFPDFGRLYGLDMTKWPTKKKRFHQDTYPGVQWNRGDFILWHGCKAGDLICWDSRIGRGRPSWNIQDPSMINRHYDETLSIYCGGFDNLFRHHDYTRAILESVRPYPTARYWLHCHHLQVDGKKMSKSRGNILYSDTLVREGHTPSEIRFFLIYGHYRKELDYSTDAIRRATKKLRDFKKRVRLIEDRADRSPPGDRQIAHPMRKAFEEEMDTDLNVKGAFDRLSNLFPTIKVAELRPDEAAGIAETLREIDGVLGVIFEPG
jgi:cysteinyl-tRNA synthetase